ncbi:cytochrome c5 family protein [Psychrobacter sp. F1192]|uniref:Cytochrome c5 family protein n=1 Tax=Psychrobacter coccoides TaxID=2818440 RepID=A0ABS3NQH4_9GAMM|nr:c-type cytochrome [Psychrobacter coccoides]MBO1531665.1 cytochrome c5 family protein [Psychrobacter coccoides]
MFKINTLLAKTGRAAPLLILSIAMTNSGAAANNIATIYNNSCAACHDTGALNAPKKGDRDTWQRLIQQKGMDGLVNSVKSGMPQMPAGGLHDNGSEEEYRQLIEYMSK